MASHIPEGMEVKIVNIISKSHILKPFDFTSLFSQFPFEPQSSLTRIFIPYKDTKFSIFSTGTVISRASKSIPDLEAAFSWLSSFLASFDLLLADHYEVINLVAFARCSPPLKLLPLASHLPHCSYDPTPLLFDSHEHPFDAIILRFNHPLKNNKPIRTALIFQSGNATFTGFKSLPDLQFHATQLSSLLFDLVQKHPEVIR